MKDELDALRRAVDEATSEAIAATDNLEACRDLEQQVSSRRADAERVHRDAVAKLTQARAALDARLGLAGPVRAPRRQPGPKETREEIRAPLLESEREPAPPEPPWSDDDDPIR